MSTFKYKPFYQYNGPTHSDPLRDELSSEEAEDRVRYFFEDIENYFENGNVSIAKDGDLVLISGELSQQECDETVKVLLNSLDLFAKKIT